MTPHTIRRTLARVLSALSHRVAPAAPVDVAAPVRERMERTDRVTGVVTPAPEPVETREARESRLLWEVFGDAVAGRVKPTPRV